MAMVAIEADGLGKQYPHGVTALDGLSFSVREGTIFALLGPNGAGKSTAVKILTTLAIPDVGTATVAGIDVIDDPQAVRRSLGVVSQASGVDVQATGRENLELQGQLHGLRGSALAQRVDELLERFGLSEAAGRIARGYSGGMQRRLDIAIALVHDPQVLFLDEPTTGLDPEVRADMWDGIAALAGEHGKTVLLTTHYLEEADQLAATVAIVDRGKVVAEGSPDELKARLRGDAVEVELGGEVNGTVHAALDRVSGVRDVTLEGRTVYARADDGARAIPTVLQALEAAGLEVAAVKVARPSLEDVYLQHAGRSFQAAETETERSSR
jgi:ABC-2 type transport system ATP-binding protein